MKRIPLIKPYITDEVKARVWEVLESGHLTEGPVTSEFEEAIRTYIGCKSALAVCNCTVGLEMGLRAMGVGPGDEVIVPDYTYPATALAVQIVGAKIVLVDVDRETMLIDYNILERAITSRTRVIVPVSIFGNPLDYERLNKIREAHNLYILEDAACSMGAKFGGVPVGKLADISVFSFHPRKFITTGEGGAVTTNNAQYAKWMESYKHFGMGLHQDSRLGTQFEGPGTNYKLSSIQAAVGLVQFSHMDELLARRREGAERYYDLLRNKPGITLPKITPNGTHSWQSCCIFVQGRNEIIAKLKTRNIEAQIGTYALHMHKAFNENPQCHILGDMASSRYAFDHCLTLPLYHDMTMEEQECVVQELTNFTGGG
jgi:perosamine synthetase